MLTYTHTVDRTHARTHACNYNGTVSSTVSMEICRVLPKWQRTSWYCRLQPLSVFIGKPSSVFINWQSKLSVHQLTIQAQCSVSLARHFVVVVVVTCWRRSPANQSRRGSPRIWRRLATVGAASKFGWQHYIPEQQSNSVASFCAGVAVDLSTCCRMIGNKLII